MKKSWRSIIHPKIHLIELKNTPIFEQLQLEEALLRADSRSFCILNQGSPRSIVMGISGQPEKLLDLHRVKLQKIPVIKRFSGGGTVIVDEETLFITFIIAKQDLPIPAFPENILRWSADLYEKAWALPHFHLKENDYCLGDRKCGGNAQYIKKDRWLHHTSFLWDYSEENMDYLLLPAQRPRYRENRSHEAFLTRLKHHCEHSKILLEQFKKELVKRLYMEPISLSSLHLKPHRQSTHLIDL